MNNSSDGPIQSNVANNQLMSEEVAENKKTNGPQARRILKDHDLDSLLLYNKRDGKKTCDFYSQLSNIERQNSIKQKERKKQRMNSKKQDKINAQLNQKIKQKSASIVSTQPPKLKQPQPRPIIKDPIGKNIKNSSFIPSNHTRTVYKSDYDEQEINKFPLQNTYYSQSSEQYMSSLKNLDNAKEILQKASITSNTFVNCDVRYFNWNMFIEEVGKFDVLIIDPPWRIKGAQKNDSQFMFSNCRFSLQYNTMSNHQIKTLPLHLISDEGFIFLWILNTQLNSSIEIMQSWGYELVEQIVWVKLRNQKVYLTHGYYFMHSYEICLVGYKNKKPKLGDETNMKLNHGLNHNVIFGEVRKKSQKPEDLYNLIEMIFKGKRKIQIFARNHNLRFGIFSIGNELGEAYDKWTLHLKCDQCKQQISSQMKRYKSKVKANFDLCEECVQSHDQQCFYGLSNEVDQDVRHEYVTCNLCGIEPIWGNRFQCIMCPDYDLCQNCFDQYLIKKTDQMCEQKIHPNQHQFRVLQVPFFGNGYHVHEYKCSSCYQNPILGVCFSCLTCKNFKLCQKCFFERPREDKGNFSKTHRNGHQFQALFQPLLDDDKKYQCFNCKKIIIENCWMCQNCYNFFFCEQCYEKRHKFKSLYANSHKKYHIYSRAF